MSSELYGRRVLLRNCGRFLNVAGDFGSNYSTHPYLSAEMLYAGLTRELSRCPRTFSEKMSGYDFFRDFDVVSLPVWFTPGILIDREARKAAGRSPSMLDTHLFNSTLEERPGIQDNNRLPKYGSMETVLPGNLFSAVAISTGMDSLNSYSTGQVFWMGKKRTMFQIADLGETVEASLTEGQCETEYVQVSSQDMNMFEAYSVLGASQRYLVASGEGSFKHLSFSSPELRCVPEFSIRGFLDTLR